MKIIFKDVTVKNFLSFGNVPTTFNYESGINIVTGRNLDNGTRNGVGKSSILVDAISFAIYGKALRGEHVNKDEIVNEINKKNCEVSVNFSIGEDVYYVKRTAKPSSFSVFVNGKDPEHEYKQDSIKQTESWLISKIGISHTCFKNIIVLNMNDTTPFLNMDASHKREVIEDVLSMNVYGRMADVAKDKHLIAKGDLKSAESKLSSNKETYDYAKVNYENLKKEKENFENEKKNKIVDLNNQIYELSIKKGKLEESLLNTDFNELIKSKTESIEKIRNIISMANTKVALITKEIKEIKEALVIIEDKPYCPSCHTPTDNPLIKQYVFDLNQKLKTLPEEQKILNEKIKKADDSFKKNNSELKELNTKKDNNNRLINDISIIKNNIQTKFEAIDHENSRQFKVDNVLSDEDLLNLKLKYETAEKEVTEHTKNHNFNLLLRKILGEDGVRRFVLSKILPFFNTKINAYLKIMGSELSLKFNTNLVEQIFTRTREQRTYGSFSAGEKKRIDISILLSLMDLAKLQNSVDTNILVLDEVLDTAMDHDGVENFLNYLKDGFRMLYPDKAVYIITHRNTISDDFYDKMIVLQKKDGFTTIEKIVDMVKRN